MRGYTRGKARDKINKRLGYHMEADDAAMM